MGSVKDLEIISEPNEKKSGEGIFVFSDRYSVFDWGEMPDQIPHKGEALCLISAYFFEVLEEKGIKTHYEGLIDENGQTVYLKDLSKPVNKMKIKLVRVIHPREVNGTYDYSVFKRIQSNFLIPLEVIYRFSLPEGSSVFKRLKEGTLSIEDMGLDRMPKPGERLLKPFIDFSTKLEAYDRYLKPDEALEISGLSKEMFEVLVKTAQELSETIKQAYEEIGIANEDGKFEFAVDESGSIIIVDTIGTPDECRFSKDGVSLSKEIARIFYRGSDWHLEVEKAKKEHGKNWKEHVKSKPEKLKDEDVVLLSSVYTSLANSITKKEFFKGAPELNSVIAKVRERMR